MTNKGKFNFEAFKDGEQTLSEVFTNILEQKEKGKEDEKETLIIPIISIALRIGTIIFCGISFAIIATNHGENLDYCEFGSDDYCWFSWKAINSSHMA